MIEFTIPGAPCGKGRPKFSTASGFARAYTPAKTASYENLVKLAYQSAAAMMGARAFEPAEAVGMRIIAHYPIPKSASKRRREEMLAGMVHPLVKPDADNVAKVICDALNGIAYHDDTQIAYLELEKLYGEEPRVYVEMWNIREV